MDTNQKYLDLLKTIIEKGDKIYTRNSSVYSDIIGLQVRFTSVPLVTIRKTAWKKALREMEWFLSGDPKCPDELLDWWDGQLNTDGCYLRGYGEQLTDYTSCNYGYTFGFNQIDWLIEAIKHSPHSRRLITTTWHPEEMSRITEINNNHNTPSNCHGTLTQYFVRKGKLYMNTTQRSCDMLLGCPHNWIQYWAFLMYLAHQTNLKVGGITWTYGDAHIYDEPSHLEVVNILLNDKTFKQEELKMVYTPTSNSFKASDFSIEGEISKPLTNIRPKLL